MDLRNCLPHMRGAAVKVGDTTYAIDADGVARDVDRAHAATLLRNRAAWQVYTERQPVGTVPGEASEEAVAAGRVPDAPAPEAPVPDVIAPAPPEEPIAAPTPEANVVEAGDGVEKVGETEWPDPSEDLGIVYLKAMADAHGVKYGNSTKPKTLVKRLRAVMYE